MSNENNPRIPRGEWKLSRVKLLFLKFIERSGNTIRAHCNFRCVSSRKTGSKFTLFRRRSQNSIASSYTVSYCLLPRWQRYNIHEALAHVKTVTVCKRNARVDGHDLMHPRTRMAVIPRRRTRAQKNTRGASTRRRESEALFSAHITEVLLGNGL